MRQTLPRQAASLAFPRRKQYLQICFVSYLVSLPGFDSAGRMNTGSLRGEVHGLHALMDSIAKPSSGRGRREGGREGRKKMMKKRAGW